MTSHRLAMSGVFLGLVLAFGGTARAVTYEYLAGFDVDDLRDTPTLETYVDAANGAFASLNSTNAFSATLNGVTVSTSNSTGSLTRDRYADGNMDGAIKADGTGTRQDLAYMVDLLRDNEAGNTAKLVTFSGLAGDTSYQLKLYGADEFGKGSLWFEGDSADAADGTVTGMGRTAIRDTYYGGYPHEVTEAEVLAVYPNFLGWSGPAWPTAANKWDPLVVEVTSDSSGMIYLGAYPWGSGTPINGIEVFAPAQEAAVPEPSTFALSALGLLGLVLCGLRRRKQAGSVQVSRAM
jgi:hypothetical protein